MVSFSAIISAVALASTYSVAQADPVIQTLPWDGRFFDLDVKSVQKKWLVHIFTMRQDPKLTTADYLTINQKGRPKSYNGDTGVANIAVDDFAIFQDKTNFRRSELVQFVQTNMKNKTFFRTSFYKKKAFQSKHVWQCIFDELHLFEIRIDVENQLIKYLIKDGSTKWTTPFKLETWYNFGFALSIPPSGKGHLIEFYASEHDKDLVLTATHTHDEPLPSSFEYHIGMLTLSAPGTAPKINGTEILSFSGASVTPEVSTAAK